MKFWLLLGATGLAVLAGINQAVQTVVRWGGSRTCGPSCVAVPSPWSQGVLALASIVGCFELGAFLAWRAAQAAERRSAPLQATFPSTGPGERARAVALMVLVVESQA